MMENNDSRTSFLFERPTTTTHHRHRPLIDPMVLLILIPPILVLLFLFLLAYVPKSIKPTSFKSTFTSFCIFIILLASLFRVFNHEDNEASTNLVVENDQRQDVNGVNYESDESSFYDAVYLPFWVEAMDLAENSDGQRTSTPQPEPWIYVKHDELDRQVNEEMVQRGTSDDRIYRDRKRRIERRIAKNRRRVAPYIPPAPASPPPQEAPISTLPKAEAQAPSAPAPTTTSTPFVKNLKKIFTPGNKSKKHPSSETPKLPPRPPLPQLQPELNQHYDRNTSSSSTSQSSGTPPPARPGLTPQAQPEPEPGHYDRQSSSSSQSSYIPEPPPPPPFDIPAYRYKYFGEYYARLRSINSNTSSSPDLQPMGQPSISMDSGDSFWSSPDVNAKAGIFISKGKDKWKMEQENAVKKKRRD